MNILFVQYLHTRWTKHSRGGEGARRRAALPRRTDLPTPDPSTVEGRDFRVLRQEIRMDERCSFRPVLETRSLTCSAGHVLKLGPAEVTLHADHVTVGCQRPWMPPGHRRRRVKPVFTLGIGQWGRITLDEHWGWFHAGHVLHFGLHVLSRIPGDLRRPPESPDFSFREVWGRGEGRGY